MLVFTVQIKNGIGKLLPESSGKSTIEQFEAWYTDTLPTNYHKPWKYGVGRRHSLVLVREDMRLKIYIYNIYIQN